MTYSIQVNTVVIDGKFTTVQVFSKVEKEGHALKFLCMDDMLVCARVLLMEALFLIPITNSKMAEHDFTLLYFSVHWSDWEGALH